VSAAQVRADQNRRTLGYPGGDDPSRGATRALAWSPDGSRIAFARTDGRGLHSGSSDGLFVINADGTGEVRLTGDLQGNLRGLRWAPDGGRIAFIWESYPPGGPVTTLMVIDANGQGLRDVKRLSVLGGCCLFESTDLQPLEWTPNADRVAVVVSEMILLVRADGSGESELTKGSYFDLSPDGSRIVVAEARLDEDPGPYSIYVMNIDGTDKKLVAEGKFPAWSPVPPE
jgi:Tol biopolymer transport system component